MKRTWEQWGQYSLYKRVILPYRFREKNLISRAFVALQVGAKESWEKKRHHILARGMLKERSHSVLKKGFLGLLQNVLKQKKKVIESKTIS